MATQVLQIKVLNCGGMRDYMSEQESLFLTSSLGLFRNVVDVGRATPRANVSLVRAYSAKDFYAGAAGSEHLLHLIAHSTPTKLQTGDGKSNVTTSEVTRRADREGLRLPEVVVCTACKFQSKQWRSTLASAGVRLLIAAEQSVTPANLTAFDMAFYAALLSQVRQGTSTLERVEASFVLANGYYRSIHAKGSPFAKFALHHLTP